MTHTIGLAFKHKHKYNKNGNVNIQETNDQAASGPFGYNNSELETGLLDSYSGAVASVLALH